MKFLSAIIRISSAPRDPSLAAFDLKSRAALQAFADMSPEEREKVRAAFDSVRPTLAEASCALAALGRAAHEASLSFLAANEHFTAIKKAAPQIGDEDRQA
jgi:hypothetical protein